MKKHWLYRPENISRLWKGGALILSITVIIQLFVPVEPHFGFDGWFGFFALYGFVTCVAMVLLSKLLGFLVKRQDDYYDD